MCWEGFCPGIWTPLVLTLSISSHYSRPMREIQDHIAAAVIGRAASCCRMR